jgi:hypothetical protein
MNKDASEGKVATNFKILIVNLLFERSWLIEYVQSLHLDLTVTYQERINN